MVGPWSIRLFGGLCAERDGKRITHFRSHNIAALLAYLALHSARTHSREELADLLWPEENTQVGRTNLRTALASLRRQLEPPDPGTGLPSPPLFLVDGRQRVGLNPDAVRVDVQQFEDLLRRAGGAAAGEAERARLLSEAVGLYRGPLLSGWPEDWIDAERARLEAAHGEALRRLARRRREQDGEPAPLLLPAPVPVPAQPPPPPPPTPPTRLPAPLTRFFGREHEIAVLTDALSSGPDRLITITGPPGCGKTRLALEVARRLEPARAERVWFVPQADAAETRHLDEAVLAALGALGTAARRRAAVPPGTRVLDALGEGAALLVLDGLEHAADAGAWAAALLERAPAVSCLVTARQALLVGGERQFPLAPLPTPPAAAGDVPGAALGFPGVALFVDRAQAARVDFQITPRNARAVAELCRRLEGLPLALELAAGWSQTRTPEQMLSALDRRLDLLVSRRPDLPPRHRSMRAAVEGSHRLLSPPLQRFFARLSVFHGGWTHEAAGAVCAQPDAERFLAELRRRSLVAADEAGEAMRFRLLDTLKDYAAEQAPPEERERLRREHAGYFLAFAAAAEPHLRGPEQDTWLARLGGEHDNLRAALDWGLEREPELALRLAAALGWFWFVCGHWSEGYDYLEKALSAADPASPARAKSLYTAGALAWTLDEYDRATACCRESARLCGENGEHWGAAFSRAILGIVAGRRGDAADAAALLDESLARFREQGDAWGTAFALDHRAVAARQAGDLATAFAFHQASLEHRSARNDRQGIAVSLSNLGDVALASGDVARAASLHEESLHRFQELGDRDGAAYALGELGRVALRQGDLLRAEALLRDSLRRFWEIRDRRRLAECLERMAGLRTVQERPEEAARLLGTAGALRDAVSAPPAADRRADRERTEAAARRALGEEAFAFARAYGRGIPLEEMVAGLLENGSAVY